MIAVALILCAPVAAPLTEAQLTARATAHPVLEADAGEETEPESETEPGTEPEPDSEAGNKSKPETKSKAETKSKPESDPGTESEPGTGTGTGTDPETGTGAETESEAGTGTGTGTNPGTGTGAGTASEAGTGTGTDTDPGTGAGTRTEPTSNAGPKDLPLPTKPPEEPKPKPKPKPKKNTQELDEKKKNDPFAKGRWMMSIILGNATANGDRYWVFGGQVSHFVYHGLTVGAGFTQWFGGGISITQLTPRVSYVIQFSETFRPYLGVFYTRSFVSDGLPDRDSLGGRTGAYFVINRNFFLGFGAVWERTLTGCDRNCTDLYPEGQAAFTF